MDAITNFKIQMNIIEGMYHLKVSKSSCPFPRGKYYTKYSGQIFGGGGRIMYLLHGRPGG